MKKLLGILLIILFAFSIYFSISNDAVINSNGLLNHASAIVPMPIPEAPPKRGC